MNSKEFKIKYPNKEFGEVNVKRDFEYPFTGEVSEYGTKIKDYNQNAQVIDKGWEIYLGHSCDEWVIGNEKDANNMIENLVKAVKYCQQFTN